MTSYPGQATFLSSMVEPSVYDSAKKLLQNAQRVALYPRSAQDIDAVASAIALAETLEASGVEPRIILGESPRTSLAFLSGSRFITTSAEPARELTIDVPNTGNAINAVSYERTPTSLRIHVTPSKPLAPTSVTVRAEQAALGDVIVVIGARRLADLGPRFSQHAEPFYQTPIISLDYHIDTETFATVQISDQSARSYAALTQQLLATFAGSLTPSIATALFTGVLAQSQSFQRSMTSPQEFDLAALLLEKGADRHAVIQHLYKTKPLPLLKLWGRVLARLEGDPQERTWFTSISAQDFAETNTTSDALVDVVHDVLAQSSRAKLIAITYERNSAEPGSPTTGILIGSSRAVAVQNFLRSLAQRVAISKQVRNEHIAHLHVRAPFQDAVLLVRALGAANDQSIGGEQIGSPRYTGSIHATRSGSTQRGQRGGSGRPGFGSANGGAARNPNSSAERTAKPEPKFAT